MLFGFVLQFTPDRHEAEGLLASVFSRLMFRLEEAIDSNLSVYCWLQARAREIILEHSRQSGMGDAAGAHYSDLLEDASPENQWVFRELFIKGRPREELALQSGRSRDHIDRLLQESLAIIRQKFI